MSPEQKRLLLRGLRALLSLPGSATVERSLVAEVKRFASFLEAELADDEQTDETAQPISHDFADTFGGDGSVVETHSGWSRDEIASILGGAKVIDEGFTDRCLYLFPDDSAIFSTDQAWSVATWSEHHKAWIAEGLGAVWPPRHPDETPEHMWTADALLSMSGEE